MDDHCEPRVQVSSVLSVNRLQVLGGSSKHAFLVEVEQTTTLLGVSKHNGTPKWMVKIMENPMSKWDDLGGKPPLFLETPSLKLTVRTCQVAPSQQERKSSSNHPFLGAVRTVSFREGKSFNMFQQGFPKNVLHFG